MKLYNFKGEILLFYSIKLESCNLFEVKKKEPLDVGKHMVLLGSWVWLCIVMTQGTREISKSFGNRSMIRAFEHTTNLGITSVLSQGN